MAETRSHRDLVVLGASWGGMRALQSLLSNLPHDLPASLLAVLHVSPEIRSEGLVANLARATGLAVKAAEHGDRLQHGRLLIAPPDRHLVVASTDQVALSAGPKENRHRPAVDPLFRSAGCYFGTRVVAVILTGSLDDGSAGLSAVARCGGAALVQSPDDAEMPDMPAAALAAVPQARAAPLAQLPALLTGLVSEPAPPAREVPEDVLLETRLAASATGSYATEAALGELAAFSCPECGGPMWRMDDPQVRRYRCHTGHAHTARSLDLGHGETINTALWTAYRAIQERRRLLDSLARDAKARGHDRMETSYRRDAEQLRENEAVIRQLLFAGPRVTAR